MHVPTESIIKKKRSHRRYEEFIKDNIDGFLKKKAEDRI
jgi:hypothetical protein